MVACSNSTTDDADQHGIVLADILSRHLFVHRLRIWYTTPLPCIRCSTGLPHQGGILVDRMQALADNYTRHCFLCQCIDVCAIRRTASLHKLHTHTLSPYMYRECIFRHTHQLQRMQCVIIDPNHHFLLLLDSKYSHDHRSQLYQHGGMWYWDHQLSECWYVQPMWS